MKQVMFRGTLVIVMSAKEAHAIGATDGNHAIKTTYPFVYGMRHSETDWTEPITIEPNVLANRFGFLLSSQALLFDKTTAMIELKRRERIALRNAMEEQLPIERNPQ